MEDSDSKKRAAHNPPEDVDGQKTKPKKTKRKHRDPAILAFRGVVHQCCKTNDFKAAMEAYDDAVDSQTIIEKDIFYALLNLCDGFGERSLHIGTPRAPKQEANEHETVATMRNDNSEVPEETRRMRAETIKKHMDHLGLPLTENCYTALIRLFARGGHLTEAETFLSEAESTQQCKVKLRCYSPLLNAYCQKDDLVEAIRIWKRLALRGWTLTEKEYLVLLQCCVKVGNALVFERILSEIAEDILVPSHALTNAIVAWFEESTGAVQSKESDEVIPSQETVRGLLAEIPSPYAQTIAPMGPVQTNPSGGWQVSRSCEIDSLSGTLTSGCFKGSALKPVAVTKEAWKDMKRMNENIARIGKLSEDDTLIFQGGGKGKKRELDQKAVDQRKFHWKKFQEYLNKRTKVEVLIDGANVGYCEQNFAGAPKHVDYRQIDWVVEDFRRRNKSVLVVMHSRHFNRNLMPREAEPLLQKWLRNDLLYRTPPAMNDDWFWLHAALHFGPETLVLTNDDMRDHHFQMVAARSFIRWRERHQIHFQFGEWESGGRRKVKLTYPDPYSRRIQRVDDGLVIPLPKQGDENRFLDGSFVAGENEPEQETYVCIRPVASS